MKKHQLIALVAVAGMGSATAVGDLLWDNGSIVTHPGQGFGGADVSMASVVMNIAGVNAGTFNGHWRRADDFAVPAPGWYVDEIVVYAYSTGAAPNHNGWDGVNMRIWDGTPGAGGSVILESNDFSYQFVDIYRVFNGQGNLQNTDRAVHAITMNFGGAAILQGDNYWIDFQVNQATGFSAWVPVVMEVNPADPWDPITVPGNHMGYDSAGVWSTYVHASGGTADIPFQIHGTVIPAPGSLALLGLACLARRRRA